MVVELGASLVTRRRWTSFKPSIRQVGRDRPVAGSRIRGASHKVRWLALGYDIQVDLGDQFSDLTGGFTDKIFELPNPNYFLPWLGGSSRPANVPALAPAHRSRSFPAALRFGTSCQA